MWGTGLGVMGDHPEPTTSEGLTTMTDLLAMLSGLPAHEPKPCIVRDTIARATAECPSLRWAQGVAVRVHDDYDWTARGTAYIEEFRIIVRYGRRYGATDADIIGVTLHELAHIACWQEGIPWGDADLEFGLKCKDAFAEWNALPGTITADETKWGAYRGQIGRANKAILAARKAGA